MEKREKEEIERKVKNGIEKLFENNTEKENMLDLIYRMREDKIDDIIKKINIEIKENLENVDQKEKENIKIGKYIKEIYKQGFKDGVNLYWSIYE